MGGTIDIASVANLATILSGVIGLVGFPYVIWQIHLTRAAASSELVVGLSESVRSSWQGYSFAKSDAEKAHYLRDVFVSVELMALLWSDGMFRGRPREYAETILRQHVRELASQPAAEVDLGADMDSQSPLLSKLLEIFKSGGDAGLKVWLQNR